MQLPVTITRVNEIAAPQSGGGSKAVLRIEWMAGNHGPFIETFDKDTFDANAVTMKLQALASKLELLGAK